MAVMRPRLTYTRHSAMVMIWMPPFPQTAGATSPGAEEEEARHVFTRRERAATFAIYRGDFNHALRLPAPGWLANNLPLGIDGPGHQIENRISAEATPRIRRPWVRLSDRREVAPLGGPGGGGRDGCS